MPYKLINHVTFQDSAPSPRAASTSHESPLRAHHSLKSPRYLPSIIQLPWHIPFTSLLDPSDDRILLLVPVNWVILLLKWLQEPQDGHTNNGEG
jgi:hypothetical protein